MYYACLSTVILSPAVKFKFRRPKRADVASKALDNWQEYMAKRKRCRTTEENGTVLFKKNWMDERRRDRDRDGEREMDDEKIE